MDDDSSPPKVATGLVAAIVTSYVGKNAIGIDQIGSLIAVVHRSLSDLGANSPASSPAALTPAVPIRRSVQPDHVACLECGFRAKTLRRHLRMSHGLEAAQYRARWKLSSDDPLTAPKYSSRRSAMAKRLGLGRPRQEADIGSGSTVEPPAASRLRGRARRRPAS